MSNGTYDVRLVVGDANANREGQSIVDGIGTTAFPWQDKTLRVTVADGRLTLSHVAGSNRHCFVEITSVPVNPN